MLQIKNLNITHQKDLRTIIKDFSITLNDGDKAAVIGEEGNGKSTLLKLIYDENLVADYADYSGQIMKKGLTIGYLAQELSREDKEKTAYEFCSKEPSFFDISPKELSRICSELNIDIEMLYSDQKLKSFSGGEKVKLQIACLMIKNPDVLLLDEPSNDIDIDTLKWLEKFINKTNVPIMYISHDEVLLENTANIIVHLEQLQRKRVTRYTVKKSGYTDYVTERLRLFEHQAQVAKNERNEYEKQQEKFRQIQQKVEHQQNNISRGDPHGGKLLKKKMHSIKSQEKRFEKQYENFTEIPESEDAIFIKFSDNVEMPNGKTVLDYENDKLMVDERVLSENIKLTITGPQKVCIIGNNGAGKTTLIKDIYSKMSHRKDINVFYMPQNYEDLLNFDETPIEFLSETYDKEENVRICTFLGSLRYTIEEMNHKISELSGGQKAKLLFLKMTMKGYDVLILDEPTRNFSPLSNPVIRKILKNFKGAIISVSHDRKYIKEVCTKVYELNENGIKTTDID